MNNILNQNISTICSLYHNLKENSIQNNQSIQKIQEIIDKTGFYIRFKKEIKTLIDKIYEFIQKKSKKEIFNVDFLKENFIVQKDIGEYPILYKISTKSSNCFQLYIEEEGVIRYSHLKTFNFLTDSDCIGKGYNFSSIFILFIENLSKKLDCRIIKLEDQSYFNKIKNKPYLPGKSIEYYKSSQEPSFYLKSIIEEDKNIEYLLYTKFIYGLIKFKTFYQEKFNFYTVYIDIYTHIINDTYYKTYLKTVEEMEIKSKLILDFMMKLLK